MLSNVVVSIEQHVEWIADHLEYLREHDLHDHRGRGTRRRKTGSRTSTRWPARTLMPKAASWYLGANVPGKPRVFMPYVGGVGSYRKICDEVAADHYRGFITA